MPDHLARRLVVTAHDSERLSKVASDTIVHGMEMPGQPGLECSLIWGADQTMHYPDDGAKPPFADFFPPVGGFRFIECYMAPHYAADADMSAQGAHASAIDDVMPGVADVMITGRPGMHRTATVDLIVVLQGRCVLTLDKDEVKLGAGDMLVESGAIHAWSNPYPEPCRFLCAVIGAKNDLCE